MASSPSPTSVKDIFLFKISGSKKAVKKPDALKQTNATDTLAYFTLP